VTVPDTQIDARRVACDLIIEAPRVRISNSETQRIEVGPSPASVAVEDSIIDAGGWIGAAVGLHRFTLKRVEVRGGQHSVQCEEDCVVVDSWLHAQALPAAAAWHNNAFISNGGSNMLISGSVLHCEPSLNSAGGGCTADLSLFGDFGPVSNVRVQGNLFHATAGGWCGSFGENPQKPFGSASSAIVVADNVFEHGSTGKCGAFGAATSFAGQHPGNVWSGNHWDDGAPVAP
jgi:hypothetical protein